MKMGCQGAFVDIYVLKEGERERSIPDVEVVAGLFE